MRQAASRSELAIRLGLSRVLAGRCFGVGAARATETRLRSLGGGGDVCEDLANVLRWYGCLPSYGNTALLELGEFDERSQLCPGSPGRAAGSRRAVPPRTGWTRRHAGRLSGPARRSPIVAGGVESALRSRLVVRPDRPAVRRQQERHGDCRNGRERADPRSRGRGVRSGRSLRPRIARLSRPGRRVAQRLGGLSGTGIGARLRGPELGQFRLPGGVSSARCLPS